MPCLSHEKGMDNTGMEQLLDTKWQQQEEEECIDRQARGRSRKVGQPIRGEISKAVNILDM